MSTSPFTLTVPSTGEELKVDFFTSDQHFGHAREAVTRGFEATPQPSDRSSSFYMDEHISRLWKDAITDDDVVMVVGDVHGGHHPSDFGHAMRAWAELPGRKFLIPGNWDHLFVRHYGQDVYDWFAPLYEQAGFEILPDEVLINYLSPTSGTHHPVLVAHHPYLPTTWSEEHNMFYKYPTFHPRPVGSTPLIYGHIHQGVMPHCEELNEFHIGVDAHDLKPVPAGTVAEWLESVLS